jgi:hypothetical protein
MSKAPVNHFDFWSLVVIVLTMVLFVTALFIKGFTHELFLEAGVFLVSVKLILFSYNNSVSARSVDERLEQLQNLLQRIEGRTIAGSDSANVPPTPSRTA